MNKTWQNHFLDLAELISKKSKDPTTKVGCVIVGPDNEIRSTGFNGFPRGVPDDPEMFPERYKRPEKYLWTAHSESNAIFNAARVGVPLKGCTLYINVALHPCCSCAVGIIQSGIVKVVLGSKGDELSNKGKWDEHLPIVLEMFKAAGVQIER